MFGLRPRSPKTEEADSLELCALVTSSCKLCKMFGLDWLCNALACPCIASMAARGSICVSNVVKPALTECDRGDGCRSGVGVGERMHGAMSP